MSISGLSITLVLFQPIRRMDKVNGLVNMLLMLSLSLELVEAQYGGVCQFDYNTCANLKYLCLNGMNYPTQVDSYCGRFLENNCDHANGPHCQGSQGSQPPGPGNGGFIPGYQPQGGGGSGQQICNVEDWRQRVLKLSNEFRSRHGVPMLVEDINIQKIAQDYAQSQVYNRDPDHNRNRGPYGENLGYGPTGRNSPEAIVNMWYHENANWNYETGTGYGITGHFTQLVWRASRKVGHGVGFTPDCSNFVIIADYYPGGNSPGGFIQNVPRPVKNPIRPVAPFHSTSAPWRQGWPSQPNTPMSFGRRIGGSVKKGSSIQLGKMCSGSSLLLFWLRAKGYMD